MSKETQKWEEFVNDFLFANYENIEYVIVKRGASLNGVLLNYIQFPKAENGRQFTKGFVNFIMQSIEADDALTKQIFGPAYEKGTAAVQEDEIDISIVWNDNYYEDIVGDEEHYKQLYDWKI